MEGNTIISPNGIFKLIMQKDCNLVFYEVHVVLWVADTNGRGEGCYLSLRSSGLYIFSSVKEVWRFALKNRHSKLVLMAEDDGNVYLYDMEKHL
ncbi:hypothetical protein SELMODRAFT_107588 [Selaginella moellendorffii]|uniref:Bulb-type lectin domain-containing protein n=1 Tax=Selaginella moellendorffii TaxID=88036 RepID=D8S371_SELML|nr:hypothetical protein SELMODRAFT_107588 [Selaginella moellendorffii]